MLAVVEGVGEKQNESNGIMPEKPRSNSISVKPRPNSISEKLTGADFKTTAKPERKEKAVSRETEVPLTAYEVALARNLDLTGRGFPVYQYLVVCNFAHWLVLQDLFNNYIFACIIFAGIVVGIQTYPELAEEPAVVYVDLGIVFSFVLEFIMKVLAEGLGPHQYFVGPEWKWNMFDFLIVLFSMPYLPIASGQIKLLRLVRLMRLAKVFKKIPELRMILEGLLGGLRSVAYILILMTLVFFLYAIMGIFIFRENDPWHFRSIEITMINLLRVAAFDNWGEMFYINYYGCEEYPSIYYTLDPDEVVNKLGGIALCDHSMAQPVLASLYFITFTFLAAFCIFALFIGAVVMSMSDSVVEMKMQKLEIHLKRLKEEVQHQIKRLENPNAVDRRTKRTVKLIKLAFTGSAMHLGSKSNTSEYSEGSPLYYYVLLAQYCADFIEHPRIQMFVTFVIIVAGVNVGLVTDPVVAREHAFPIQVVDDFVQIVFAAECALKIIAEDVTPWLYFNSGWNKFDFAVVAGSFVPTGGSMIVMLRLFRLLRVLKLMKALPQLQVMITALVKGFGSIGYIGVILGLFFYFFSILGVTLFGTNDLEDFGTLHHSFFVLFRCVTLDNWSTYMYNNLYGCAVYTEYSGVCSDPQPQFVVTFIFFVVVMVIGTLVLLSLFIGVVTMSMEEATLDQSTEKEVQDKTAKIAAVKNLSRKTVQMYLEVFEMVDFTQQKLIGKSELKFGLQLANVVLSDADFDRVWRRVDKDRSHSIDFGEFLEFMIDLREQQVATAKKLRHDRVALRKASLMELVKSGKTEGEIAANDHPPNHRKSGVGTTHKLKKYIPRVTALLSLAAKKEKDHVHGRHSHIEDEHQDEEEKQKALNMYFADLTASMKSKEDKRSARDLKRSLKASAQAVNAAVSFNGGRSLASLVSSSSLLDAKVADTVSRFQASPTLKDKQEESSKEAKEDEGQQVISSSSIIGKSCDGVLGEEAPLGSPPKSFIGWTMAQKVAPSSEEPSCRSNGNTSTADPTGVLNSVIAAPHNDNITNTSGCVAEVKPFDGQDGKEPNMWGRVNNQILSTDASTSLADGAESTAAMSLANDLIPDGVLNSMGNRKGVQVDPLLEKEQLQVATNDD